MPYFNIVAQTSENTVVTEYEPVRARSDNYQSGAARTGVGKNVKQHRQEFPS